MAVRIALDRTPVEVALRGGFQGCTVTLRRLTSNEFAEAESAAKAVMQDKGRLVELLEEHDLRPPGRKIRALTEDPMFMVGVGEWLAAVECGVRAITAWTGILAADGTPLPVDRKALEAAFLNDAFLRQVLPEIDKAALLVVAEGKG